MLGGTAYHFRGYKPERTQILLTHFSAALGSTVLVADGDNSTGAVAATSSQASSCTVVEPTVLIVLLLESAGPPAINLGVMALLHAW